MTDVPESDPNGWQFWIDRGGTFTDVIGCAPDGTLVVRKLLSENPERYADAAVAAIGAIVSAHGSQAHIDAIKMGTTVGTNALLERRGESTVLAITAGFADALRIGYQNRPDIFALDIRLPQRLYGPVIEIEARMDADGTELSAPDLDTVGHDLARLHAAGYRAIAVCLLHAWRNPEHERAVGDAAMEAGFSQVSLSHEVLALQKLVSRGDTTVADAYLSPVLGRYVATLESELAAAGLDAHRLMFMQSNGGLTDRRFFRGRDCILSGPAGGLVGMVEAGDGERLIGFDMGGTSTDVSLYAGEFEYADDFEIDGIRVRTPILQIHTIAAGGGSRLRFESGRFQVGPESAGADPGPACYRRGGPLTITDANLLLGRLVGDTFPAVFGSRGDQSLDLSATRAAFDALTREVNAATGGDMSPERVAEGFLRIAVDNMANAIKHVSIRRGYDAGEFTLCCFGGAGGQHACAVADQLGISRIVVHPLAGVLSAFGIGVAPVATYAQRTVDQPLDQNSMATLASVLDELKQQCHETLAAQGVDPEFVTWHSVALLRVAGTDTALGVAVSAPAQMSTEFARLHRRRFGFGAEAETLEIASLRVEATAPAGRSADLRSARPTAGPTPPARQRIFADGSWREARVVGEHELKQGERLTGPVIVTSPTGTTVVDAGWSLHADDRHRLVMERTVQRANPRVDERADPVLLEVFNNHFMHIAEQMGAVLENTAWSVNIKERLDFSCALFDAAGALIANAPHIPVHLGSMGDSVQAILRANEGRIRRGDVFMLNSPYAGGSHLPDITVVTPVFDERTEEIEFVVACRAHHADVGGRTPGSMPPFSRCVEDEGVLFENFCLVEGGVLQIDQLRARLAAGPWRARNPERNIADLRAQLAANEKGVQLLGDMVAHFGRATVRAYMRHVQDNAAEAVREVIDGLTDGQFTYPLDGGLRIRAAITVDRGTRSATIDFTGTSEQSPGNFNAPVSIARACVLYVFRSLVSRRIPLNAGCLRPLHIVIPTGSLLNPDAPAAVVAGNVETSQCIANCLLLALGAAAAGQGTMNNLTFGDDEHQYYETICGGAGATPGFAGADAVHTHMTNSRITDPEVLEQRLPVRLHRFAIRHGSGGAGRQRGGDGVCREIEFLRPMRAAILSNHRETAPPGLDGGEDGACGRNRLVDRDGGEQILPGTAEFDVRRGDRLIIETPGGGACGKTG